MGASGSVRSFAIEIIAVCAGRVRAIGNMTPKSGGKRHRQRVNINAISNHMLASIRWQIAPWWGESASLGDSVSVFQFVSPPTAAQAIASIWPAICVCDTRWHRPACASSKVEWTKLQTNQPLTKQRAGETHYRGQTTAGRGPGYQPSCSPLGRSR